MIAKFKDALLSERHEYFKWLHKIRVAKFLGNRKKGNLITLHNITPKTTSGKDTLLYRFEDDPIDMVRRYDFEPARMKDGNLMLIPANCFHKKYIPLGVEISYKTFNYALEHMK